MSTVKALVLDFDGVIIESNQVKTNAFIHVFGRFPEYKEEIMAFHYANVSMTRFLKFDYLLELMGKTGNTELKTNIADDFSKKVMESMFTVPLVKGAFNFLEMMSSRIPLFLASVTPEEELVIILNERKLFRWFKGVYGCPPWTKSEAINNVLLRGNLRSEEVLLIGDSAGDQRCAVSTGVRFIARDSGLPFDEPKPIRFADMDEINIYINEELL